MSQLSHIRWLFFDLGSTLINEERAIRDRIQEIGQALGERGIQVSSCAIERAFEEASAEFAPRLVARAVEKLTTTPGDQAFVL